jgi:hypothetical protein
MYNIIGKLFSTADNIGWSGFGVENQLDAQSMAAQYIGVNELSHDS